MSIGRNIAFISYLLAIALSFLFAVLYLFRKEFMPYHAVAVGTTWEKVDRKFQVLLIALLRVCGGGFLSNAVAMGVLLFIPFKNGRVWANWALLLAGLSISIPTLIATLIVKFKSSGKPPWHLASLSIILSLVGFILGLVYLR